MEVSDIAVIKYPNGSMTEQVFSAGTRFPDVAAYEYFGFRRSFLAFEKDVRRAAASLTALGIKKGDRMMLSLPNVPQAIVIFYALNLIGAVACMTHPLSSADEMDYFISESKPRAFITLYQFYDKFKAVLEKNQIEATVLTGPGDALPQPLRFFMGLREKKPKKQTAARLQPGERQYVYRWEELFELGLGEYEGHGGHANDVAAVLYSGGTTGKTKGILLTNLNFNALAVLTARSGNCIIPHTKMLTIMPVFHGFGLGISIHTALFAGVSCILVPRFSVKSYAKLLKKQKPNYIAGVPTLFEALLRLENTEKIDLSMLRGVFSGGDMLPPDLRRRVDEFLLKRGSPVGVREGYGLTECVTASCLTPADGHREGSIGIPYDDIMFKIVTPDTQLEVTLGETGEICLSGPTVMLGYDNNDEETELALQVHSDGREWLHTGDLGSMDADGYVYFRGRQKRMIITSGYNVYPYEIERVLGAHEYVKLCAVIGVPDDYRMQKIKALVVLRDDAPNSDRAVAELEAYCKKALAPFNRPREFEIRSELPTTLVGKVSYAQLEGEG